MILKNREPYSVRIDGTERDVYHTEFFDFVYAVKEKEEINVEIEVSKPHLKRSLYVLIRARLILKQKIQRLLFL